MERIRLKLKAYDHRVLDRTVAAIVEDEYPKGDRNPESRSFLYLRASKYTLLLDRIPRKRAGPKSVVNEAPSRLSAQGIRSCILQQDYNKRTL